jgi:NMD protein affecting ribosome stability and mRNA decay
MDYTTFTAQEFIDGKIYEMNDANKVYRAMAETIGADTEIADNLMGRGSENRALLRAIYQRLNEVIGEEE